MAFYPARDTGRQVSSVAEWRKSHFTSITRFRYCSYLQRFLICRVRGDSPYCLCYEACRGISKPSYPLPSIFHTWILTVWAKHLFISPLCKGPRGILGVPPATPYSWLEDIPPNGKLNGPGERYYILFPKFLKWRFPSFVQEAFFSIRLRGPKGYGSLLSLRGGTPVSISRFFFARSRFLGAKFFSKCDREPFLNTWARATGPRNQKRYPRRMCLPAPLPRCIFTL